MARGYDEPFDDDDDAGSDAGYVDEPLVLLGQRVCPEHGVGLDDAGFCDVCYLEAQR